VDKYQHFRGTLVRTYKSTWYYNPEQQHSHLHQCENLKSKKLPSTLLHILPTSTPYSVLSVNSAVVLSDQCPPPPIHSSVSTTTRKHGHKLSNKSSLPLTTSGSRKGVPPLLLHKEPKPQATTVKPWFYAHFVWSQPHAHKNMLINFMFLQLYVFPKVAPHFYSLKCENVADFTFYISILWIIYPRQQTSFPISSWEWLLLIAHCILSTGWCITALREHVIHLCKKRPVQRTDHCGFVSGTINRNTPRWNS
jgi:hypothetical protein